MAHSLAPTGNANKRIGKFTVHSKQSRRDLPVIPDVLSIQAGLNQTLAVLIFVGNSKARANFQRFCVQRFISAVRIATDGMTESEAATVQWGDVFHSGKEGYEWFDVCGTLPALRALYYMSFCVQMQAIMSVRIGQHGMGAGDEKRVKPTIERRETFERKAESSIPTHLIGRTERPK